MQTFDQSLMQLVKEDRINVDSALQASSNPHEFMLRLKGIQASSDTTWDRFEHRRPRRTPCAPPGRRSTKMLTNPAVAPGGRGALPIALFACHAPTMTHNGRRRPAARPAAVSAPREVIHRMFKKILICNRGEIALRVMRACRELDIACVAIHSAADKESLHVKYADESVCVGKATSADSYLKIANIIAAAEITGAEAIHPGLRLPGRERRTSPRWWRRTASSGSDPRRRPSA